MLGASRDKIEDSYLYLRADARKDLHASSVKEQKQVDYICIIYDEFDNWTPDYKYYAEQVIKRQNLSIVLSWETSASEQTESNKN